MPVINDDIDLMPTYAVGDYFGRGSRTVERWQRDPELNFPQPIVIRKRKYWRRGEIREWELRQLARRMPA
jgi:predicted DNA-binding transcriptional regulator AlpA